MAVLTIASVLLVSASAKVFSPAAFKSFVQIGLENATHQHAALIMVVAVECIVAILIINQRTRFIGLASSAILIVFFTFVLLGSKMLGADVACGCFGDIEVKAIDDFPILRNVLLLMVVGLAIERQQVNRKG